jgi:hypothetical protein
MTNGIAQVVTGIALAAAIGGVAALNPGYKPHEDVADLKRQKALGRIRTVMLRSAD